MNKGPELDKKEEARKSREEKVNSSAPTSSTQQTEPTPPSEPAPEPPQRQNQATEGQQQASANKEAAAKNAANAVANAAAELAAKKAADAKKGTHEKVTRKLNNNPVAVSINPSNEGQPAPVAKHATNAASKVENKPDAQQKFKTNGLDNWRSMDYKERQQKFIHNVHAKHPDYTVDFQSKKVCEIKNGKNHLVSAVLEDDHVDYFIKHEDGIKTVLDTLASDPTLSTIEVSGGTIEERVTILKEIQNNPEYSNKIKVDPKSFKIDDQKQQEQLDKLLKDAGVKKPGEPKKEQSKTDSASSKKTGEPTAPRISTPGKG